MLVWELLGYMLTAEATVVDFTAFSRAGMQQLPWQAQGGAGSSQSLAPSSNRQATGRHPFLSSLSPPAELRVMAKLGAAEAS